MAQQSVTASTAPRASFFSDLKHDLPASIAVTLVALPLCLGIALACEAPLAAGLLAGIIGGIVVGALSGSHTSVSGPAAGLTAVVLAALHQFDNAFSTFLVAVVLAGVIQIVLGVLRAGVISNYFPSAVVSGMLASIGLILIFKQIPHAVGYDVDPEGEFSFFQPDAHNTFSELVYMLGNITPAAVAISALCLVAIVAWESSRLKKLFIPSALIAVLIGTFLNLLLRAVAPEYALSQAHLVNLPQLSSLDDLTHFFAFPNWSMITNEAVWLVALELAFIASLETLLNLEGIDKIDPQRRHSPPNRELMAQGIGNVVSGLVGGLPITSVVVRSSVNLNSGAASRKSTIIHGSLIAGCVLLIPSLLNQIPLAALAAILLFTGYKLASLKTFRQFYHRGLNQLLPFVATIVAILFTDLLIGVLIGLAVGVFFVLRKNIQMPFLCHQERHAAGEIIRLKLGQQVTFLNRASLRTTLSSLPEAAEVLIDAKSTEYVDRDIMELLREFRDVEAPAKRIRLSVVGLRDEYAAENQLQFISVPTREMQATVSPAEVLAILKEGNQRFMDDRRLDRDLKSQVILTSQRQYPIAAVLGCIDSRTTSELIFDLGLGDIFAVRVAGNVANDDVLGSLEYATAVAGAKLIVVLGHTNCGAINAACDHVRMGHVTGLLAKIQHAVEQETTTKENRSSSNIEFVRNVTRLNVAHVIDEIRRRSPTVSELLIQGKVGLVGAIYHLETGEVEFLDKSEAHSGIAPTSTVDLTYS